MSKVLPDDTWLTQFELKSVAKGKEVQRELMLRGETSNAGRLVQLFEESQMFAQAAQRGPDHQDPAGSRRDIRPRRAAQAATGAAVVTTAVAETAAPAAAPAARRTGRRTRRRAPAAHRRRDDATGGACCGIRARPARAARAGAQHPGTNLLRRSPMTGAKP